MSDGTRAVRDTARGSKNRTTAGAVRRLFQAVRKTLTARADDEAPQASRRRREETGRGFRELAREFGRRIPRLRGDGFVRQSFKARAAITSRYVAIPAEAYEAATRYLSTAFDLLNLMNDDAGEECGEAFDTGQNCISPHL